jgi:hypothetical protein
VVYLFQLVAIIHAAPVNPVVFLYALPERVHQ